MLIEKRSIQICTYNLETVLAEKLETIISRNIANTRMRDFYDIYILTELKWVLIRPDLLRSAFAETSKYRGNQNLHHEAQAVFDAIKASPDLERHWQNYQRRYAYASETTYSDVCLNLGRLIHFIQNENTG